MNKKFLKQSFGKQLFFSHWSRKSFAVFSSLKSVVNIGVLTGTLSILAIPEKGYSQTDTIKVSKHLDIDEVVVSSNRTQKMYSDVSRVMTVIPASEIRSTAAQSVSELLKSLPGIDIRQRGGQGVQSDISIRGGSFEQTLILLNGIPINDPQTGHHNLNIPINLESIERIEVLHGAAARVFGPNAFAGAVNIITNSSNAERITAMISAGEYGLFDGSASMQINTGKINHYFAVGTKSSDGYINNTDFKSYNLFYRGILNTKAGQIGVQGGYLNKAFGAQDFYTLDFPEQFEQIRQTTASLNYRKTFYSLAISGNVYFKENHDRFELFREDKYNYQNGYYIADANDTAKYYAGIYAPWNYYRKHNYHMTQVGGVNFNAEYKSKFGRTAAGFDYRVERIFSNVLGLAIDTIDAPGETHGFFSKSANRRHINIFAEHGYTLNKFDITAGILFHNNNDYGSGFYAGVETSYEILNNIRIFGSVNQAMRMPTYTDLYYDGPSNKGNPNLKPEESITYEMGVKGFQSKLQWQAAIFNRITTDAIDWVKNPSETEYTTVNFTELNALGTDLSLKVQPALWASGAKFIRYISGSYSFADVTTVKQDSSISAYSLDYLRQKATISTDINVYKGLGLRFDFSYNRRNGDFEDVNDSIVTYKPYILIDTRLYYEHKNYLLFIDANNLLNSHYMDIGGIQQAGLWIKGGVKINFDFN